MRETLYRGKRIDNGEWVYGCLHLEYEGIHNTLDGAYIIGKYAKTYNNAVHGALQVVPDSVGQYTGQNATNGKIFEGDIIKATGLRELRGQSDIYLVVFSGGAFDLQLPGVDYCASWCALPDKYYSKEVVGNIHDNPELFYQADRLECDNRQRYYVTLRVDARYVTDVVANSIEEAKELAMDAWMDCDIGDLKDTTGEVVIIENENGDFVYEK